MELKPLSDEQIRDLINTIHSMLCDLSIKTNILDTRISKVKERLDRFETNMRHY